MPINSRLTGGLLILGSFVAVIILAPGASFASFVDPPSLMWVCAIVSGGLLLGGFHPGEVIEACRNGLFAKQNVDPDQLRRHAQIFDRAYQLAWGAGIVGSLLGLIIMLGNMDNPDAIGPGIAMSLISILYGVVLAEFVIKGLQAGLNAVPETARTDETKNLMLGKGITATLLILVSSLALQLAAHSFL